MKILKSISELRTWRRGETGNVGVVPTLGALHEGHGSLIRRSVSECESTIVTIFVNPKQFGPGEDLDSYPRTWESDEKLCKGLGVTAVFLPNAKEMYPDGFSTYVQETALSLPLCGASRPGHFRGVTTVVAKLLNLVQPQYGYFGLKDAQQFFVIRKMVEDLNMPLEVKGVETVREADGLALSSRNIYLSAQEREVAPLIYKTLKQSVAQIESRNDPKEVLESSRSLLVNSGFDVQYLELRDTCNLELVNELRTNREYLLAVAAYLGKTRLIDNIIFTGLGRG